MKLRFLFLLLLPVPLFAQTAAVTGVALDNNGNTVAGATITVCPQGSSGIPCTPVTAATTSNGQGAFSVTVAVGTYTVTVFRSGVVATSSTVVVAPSNITIGVSVTYNGNVTFIGALNSSGPATFTGALTSSNSGTAFKYLNNIRFADQFAGADCGAKINAADLDLGATAGEIWVSQACGTTISTAVSIGAGPNNFHVLRFIQPGVWTLSASITVVSVGSGIIGITEGIGGAAGGKSGPVQLKQANTTNLSFLVTLNAGEDILHDFILDGNASNNPTGGPLVRVDQAVRVDISGMVFQASPVHGVWLDGVGNSNSGSIRNSFFINNNGDAVFSQKASDWKIGEASEFEANGLTATVNTTNTTITAASGSWSTSSSLIGSMVRVNNTGMCQILAVPSTTTLTVAATTCWNASGVPTGLGTQTGVGLNMGNGIELSDSPTFRISHIDVGGNKMGGILAYGTSTGLGVNEEEIGGATQFGNQFQHDIEIIGSCLDSQTVVCSTGNVISGNVLRASANHAVANTFDHIKLVDGGANVITPNFFLVSSTAEKAAIEQVESASSRFGIGNANVVTGNTLSGSWGTAAYVNSTVNGAFGMQVPLSGSGNGLSSMLDLFDTTGAASTPHKGLRINGGTFQVINNAGSPIFEVQDGGLIFAHGDTVPITPGGNDLGRTGFPWGNLWLGTAATNNFKFQPAATTAARIVSIPDPGLNVNLAFNLRATSAAFATATTAGTCVQSTTAVAGATTSMVAKASPVSTPGVGAVWSAFVSSSGNVTINECAVATSIGGTIAFNIEVTP